MNTPQHKTLPSLSMRTRMSRFVLVATTGLFAVTGSVMPAFAVDYNAQIQQKQAELNAAAAQANSLQVYGNTIQEAVNNLQAQINNLQAQISANSSKRTELEANIAQAQIDISKRQDALAAGLQALYIEGNVSNLEKIASAVLAHIWISSNIVLKLMIRCLQHSAKLRL
jgi:peptidoglycan hydrolase CwlO-like protein